MASRDLTSAFLERRSAANMRRRNDKNGYASGPSKKLTAGGSDDLLLAEEGGIQMSSITSQTTALPPQWVDDVDAVHSELSEIVRLMDILQSLHASRVGSVFGKDLDDMEGRIEKLTQDVTDRFRQAERYLQRVGAATKRAGGEEATVGANVQRSLAKRLQELSAQFRQSQRKYLAEVQAQKSGGNPVDAKFGIDLNTDGGFFNTQQLAVVDDLTEAVQSRDHEIVKIAQSIEELGAIFKELAVLVIDQGTILDRIDYNMEAVVEHTKTGIQQLEKAEKHQKNARPMKCIFGLLALIGLLLIILVLKHRH
ncbi:glycosyltransferase-like protein [Fragilaria crotonensis]|nr:glycosyltransferase-like protein [Fragilaria crotonensis]